MIITYNFNPLFKKDLGSISKSYLKLKLWVVKLLKMNIENHDLTIKTQDAVIQHVLPKLLPGPNLQFCFMKNSVYTSLLRSLISINQTLRTPKVWIPEKILTSPACSRSQYSFLIWIIIVLICKIWETSRNKLKKHFVTKNCSDLSLFK